MIILLYKGKAFRKHLIDVVLEVDKTKAFYFESKKFLSSQQIIERKENGNLLVGYQITQEIEIDELIKRWLPYVWVVEPLSLRERIERELRGYLKGSKIKNPTTSPYSQDDPPHPS